MSLNTIKIMKDYDFFYYNIRLQQKYFRFQSLSNVNATPNLYYKFDLML